MRTKTLAIGLVAAQLGAVLAFTPPAAAATLLPSEWVVGPDRRLVMLTFDGQTRARPFLSVLETLARANAKASFFLPGRWVEHHQDKARVARAAGTRSAIAGTAPTASRR